MKTRVALLVFLMFCVLVLIFTNFGYTGTKVYDCRYSEISPDYPVEVKEECRRLRYEQWKQEQDEQTKRKLILT